MSRVLRLLLVAAFVAGPAAAMPPAGEVSFRSWVVTASDAPAASALTAVVDPPPLVGVGVGTARIERRPDGRSAGDRNARWARVPRTDPDVHRPRVERRHRPAPRSADGEPPA